MDSENVLWCRDSNGFIVKTGDTRRAEFSLIALDSTLLQGGRLQPSPHISDFSVTFKMFSCCVQTLILAFHFKETMPKAIRGGKGFQVQSVAMSLGLKGRGTALTGH